MLPTSYDPFSNATLEALACGCPVLTTRTNGASEIIKVGQTGLLFSSLEKSAIAKASDEFLSCDFQDRTAVAESVSKMTRENEISHYSALLKRILSN